MDAVASVPAYGVVRLLLEREIPRLNVVSVTRTIAENPHCVVLRKRRRPV
jgi:hypothetical protein